VNENKELSSLSDGIKYLFRLVYQTVGTIQVGAIQKHNHVEHDEIIQTIYIVLVPRHVLVLDV